MGYGFGAKKVERNVNGEHVDREVTENSCRADPIENSEELIVRHV